MSEETESSPESNPKPATEATPRARKTATSRARKVAKSTAKGAEAKVAIPAEIPAPLKEVEDVEPPVRETPSAEESSPQHGGDWAESEGETSAGGQGQSESGKRKRRRRKGKGQSAQAPVSGGSTIEESQALASGEPKPADAPRDQGSRPNPQQQRPRIDPEHLAKMAWKIYLAEVSEEGVALIGDNDAKDLSRRCFRLAEIFIEEQGRRR